MSVRRSVSAILRLCGILSLVLLPRGATAQAAPLTGLDAYVEAAMKDWEVPGLAISVVRNDSVIFARGYGTTELGGGRPVDENTLFAIASTTKAFTAAALGMLVDEGRVSWDERVTTYLPGFELRDPYVTRELTVRDLLTHRVGIARQDNIWIAAPFDRAEVLRRARYLPQVDGFRARYGYNNVMYIAAGEVVGAVSGRGWDDFIAERIFGPLGMSRSTTRADVVETRENVTASHTRVDGRVQAVPRRDYDNIGGAGAIFSSVHDMAQWVRFHLAGGMWGHQRLLSDSVLAEMYTPQTVIRIDSVGARMFPDTRFKAYGFGWNVQDYQGRRLIHHSGSINYTRTQVGMMPEQGIGVVVIANLSSSTLQLALMYRVLDALLGLEPTDWSAEYLELAHRGDARAGLAADRLAASRLEGTAPSVPLEQYEGTFANDVFGDVRVRREGDGLVMDYSPEYVADLEHWHHDTFRAVWRRPGDGRSFVTFALDESAHITALDLEDFGSFVRRAGGRYRP